MNSVNLKIVLKNTFLIMFSQQASSLINFIQVIILTRYYGIKDYGILTTVGALPQTIIFVTELGINSIMLRLIASGKEKIEEIFPKVFIIKLVLSLLYYIIILILVNIVKYESELKYFIIITSTTILLNSYNQAVMSVYRAKENFKYESVIGIIQSVLSLIVIIVAINGSYRLNGIILGNLIANVLLTIYVYYDFNKYYIFKYFKIDYSKYSTLIKSSIPFALFGLVSPLFLNIDIIMLSRLSNYESVGLYNAAYRIILFLFVIPFALNRALFPNLARLYDYNKSGGTLFEKNFFNAYKVTVLLGFPISVGIFLLSEKIIHLLFSENFNGSVVPLKYFSIMLVFNFIRSIYSVVLYSSKYEIQAIMVLAAGTIINVLLDYILIPKYNIVGACCASLISEIIICLATYYCVRKYIFNPKFIYNTYRVFLSSVIMGVCVYIIIDMNIIVQIFVGIISYIFAVYILNVFTVEEKNVILKLIGTHD